MHSTRGLVALLTVAAVTFTDATTSRTASGRTPTVTDVKRPNFVFIFLDDMRLDDMVAMPRVKKHITDRGTNVSNFFVNTPVCCPSRATLFSGRYPHNLRMKTTEAVVPCCMHMDILYGHVASPDAPASNELCSNPGFWKKTFNFYLRQSGYNTGIFGKAYHMGDDAPCGHAGNGYGPGNQTVQTNTSSPFMLPGWDRHFVYCYPLDQYFWNRYNDQGELVGTRDAPEDYATAVLGNKTVAWLRDAAIPEAKKDGGRPFFAYVPLHPPHGVTQPAPWYNSSWPKSWEIPERVNRARPNYGYLGADHHWLIATEPAITEDAASQTDRTFVQRLQMLMSVDDLIGEVAALLDNTGVLDNTYLMVCADHGWNLGEFRVMSGKHQVYEHTIRVPFAITGPGIKVGNTIPDVMAMVDVAPTLLELAGVDSKAFVTDDDADRSPMDGRSFAPVLLGKTAPWARTTMLVEFFSLASNPADEPPCGPITPGTGPFVTKSGRGGCPASKAMYNRGNFSELQQVEAVCRQYNCGFFIYSQDPANSKGHAWFCAIDDYGAVDNAAQWPLWTVGHRTHPASSRGRGMHVVSDTEMTDTAAVITSGTGGSACFDQSQSHSDVANNTFIGLRIVNASHDLTYAEYTDVRDWDFNHVYFRELYNLRADPFQLHNIWSGSAPDVQLQLYDMLRAEFRCQGGNCSF